MPSKTKRTVEITTKVVGGLVEPVITVSGIPETVEVGDKVTPAVTVEYPAETPLENVPIDFFIEDTLGVSEIGTRQLTDADGLATASEGYYVGVPEATQSLKFVIVINKKTV
jgi:predicted peptidase